MKKQITGLIVAAVCLLFFSCAQTQYKAELPADTDTRSAISQADAKIATAYEQQWDVLAKKELIKSSDHLKKAKKYDAKGKDREDVLEELAEFETHYNRAQTLSSNRMTKVQGLLEARRAALNSGVRDYSRDEAREFYKLDQEFRDLSEESDIDTEDYAELQSEYLNLAGVMKQNVSLDRAREQVEWAIDNKAKKHAPQALNTAQLDIKSAENMIAANLDKPEAYQPAVEKANFSAAMLAAIVSEQKKVGYNLDESAARRLIEQNGTVARLNDELMHSTTLLRDSRSELQTSQDELAASQQALLLTQEEVDAQNARLREADAERRFQEALAEAQRQFSPSEADVYRQGDKILIRLKGMEFPSGTAKVPERSKALLDRVAAVAQDLNPSQVVVEGHTDSVGSAAVNESLSQKRAENVVDYLATSGIEKESMEPVGYGFQKPITTNKSKEGRAQNRRVDVWITPAVE